MMSPAVEKHFIINWNSQKKYETYKKQILSKMDEMYAAEFMDACRELFECGRDSCDDNLMNHILRSMNQYMEKISG